jgi:hypothetical protein
VVRIAVTDVEQQLLRRPNCAHLHWRPTVSKAIGGQGTIIVAHPGTGRQGARPHRQCRVACTSPAGHRA